MDVKKKMWFELSVYSLGEVPGSDGSGHHRRADVSPWYDVLVSICYIKLH